MCIKKIKDEHIEMARKFIIIEMMTKMSVQEGTMKHHISTKAIYKKAKMVRIKFFRSVESVNRI